MCSRTCDIPNSFGDLLLVDLRSAGCACLPHLAPTGDGGCRFVSGPLLLQIIDCRDIGHPSHRSDGRAQKAQRLLRLTDGTNDCSAFERTPLLHTNDADLWRAGAKLVLRKAMLFGGIFILEPATTSLLGGSCPDALPVDTNKVVATRQYEWCALLRNAELDRADPPPSFTSIQEANANAMDADTKESTQIPWPSQLPAQSPPQQLQPRPRTQKQPQIQLPQPPQPQPSQQQPHHADVPHKAQQRSQLSSGSSVMHVPTASRQSTISAKSASPTTKIRLQTELQSPKEPSFGSSTISKAEHCPEKTSNAQVLDPDLLSTLTAAGLSLIEIHEHLGMAPPPASAPPPKHYMHKKPIKKNR
mmetsp:Transcript_62511/g.104026  ORF Transcript_62511/g.104026 Transcript_62511/m.104026 type:complete len:359 (+) Transcript_62511:155-1231(+)